MNFETDEKWIIYDLLNEDIDISTLEVIEGEIFTISSLNLEKEIKFKLISRDIFFVSELFKKDLSFLTENELNELITKIKEHIESGKIKFNYQSKEKEVPVEEFGSGLLEVDSEVNVEKIAGIGSDPRIPIEQLNLSNSAYNSLKRNRINFVDEMLKLTESSLLKMRGVGVDKAKLIMSAINEIKSSNVTKDQVDPEKNFDLWVVKNKKQIKEYFKLNDVNVSDLPLSVRSVNGLMLANIQYLSDFVVENELFFKSINQLGKKSIEEILKIKNFYLRDNKNFLISHVSDAILPEHEDVKPSDIDSYFLSPQYKDKALEFIENHNIFIKDMGLSIRAYNGLEKSGIYTLLDLVKLSYKDILEIQSLGKKSIDDVLERKRIYLLQYEKDLIAYCNNDFENLYNKDFIKKAILDIYKTQGFNSLSYRRIKEKLPENIIDEKIKQAIGSLLQEDKLEYVDFRLYRRYPSFFSYLKTYNSGDERNDAILKARYSLKTLQEVADEFGLTRERVRQIAKKCFDVLKGQYTLETGMTMFDEDYYSTLFENYDVSKEVWSKYICVPSESYMYLKNTYKSGEKDIKESLSDESLDLSLKLKIRNYLNKDKVKIDGKLLNKRRSEIEEHVLRHYCKNEIHFSEFCMLVNKVLEENNIPFDEKLHYTEDIEATRSNRLLESNCCLWKEGKRLRYYEIDNTDFSELLDTLNLESYKNTEVSTLKFIRLYPELMKKYDIRDQYELHNLLKKSVDATTCNDIDFSRQPIIKFGNFSREQMIYDLISSFSPISSSDLVNFVVDEYGYDKLFVQMNLLTPFSMYYHNGMYSVDFKEIPEENLYKYKNALKDDFYFLNELKDKYIELFPNADLKEINPRSLKQLGFNIFSNYALQNYSSLEAFFKEMLTANDIFDMSDMRKRYGNIVMFDSIFIRLKKAYEIFEYGKNKIINFRKLEKAGITKQDIEDYCSEVANFVEEGRFFSISKIRKEGFVSKLDELGFDDWFYWNIVSMDDRFVGQHIYNGLILCKTDNLKAVTKKSFVTSEIEECESIDVDDFVALITDKYDVKPSRQDILTTVGNTDLYFDQIMNKIYINENVYYAEFDD